MAKWWATGASVRGASHLRSGQVNQDALKWQVHSEGDRDSRNGWAAITVADGHGSEKYFRSERGAELAAKAALEIAGEMVTTFPEAKDIEGGLQDLKKWFQLTAPQVLVRRWIDLVLSDIENHPYGAEERDLLGNNQNPSESTGVHRPATRTLSSQLEEVRPYGAALGFVLGTESYIAYASIGDVDLVTITGDGLSVRAISMSEELGEATFSLCMPNSASYFQTEFHILTAERAPSLVFIASDGFSKSFATEDEFLTTCRAYAEALWPMSLESPHSELAKWLQETTDEGSGDDVTVGMLFNFDQANVKVAQSQCEEESDALHLTPTEEDASDNQVGLRSSDSSVVDTSQDTASSQFEKLVICDGDTFIDPGDEVRIPEES